MEEGRDYWYHDLMALPIARSAANSNRCETEVMDAEDPLFMLYTSGTTGKPKAILHTHGGYMVGVATTLKWVFDLKEEDRWWCAADPGWITGHSYIVYGPLLLGATSFMYEGAPTYPYPNRWWSMVEKYGINVLYTRADGHPRPDALRRGVAQPPRSLLAAPAGQRRRADQPRGVALVSSRDRQGALPDHGHLVADRDRHVHDHAAAGGDLKPGSATRPFPGIEADVVDEQGNPAAVGEEGYLVLKTPWPAMLRTIYKDPDRYVQQYWSKYPGVYFTGDSARKDEDGYFWIIGRVDDVIKVSGYRLGTAEIESALVSHPAVAEAAAIGLPHEIKGNAIHTYVILKCGLRAERGAGGGAEGARRPRAGPDRQAGEDHLRAATAQDAQRQDHAPRAAGARAGVAGRGSDDAGRITSQRTMKRSVPCRRRSLHLSRTNN